MVMQVLDHPDFAATDTSSVRGVGYGGAPAPPDLVRRIKALFPGAGASNGYGLTETSALATMNSGHGLRDQAGQRRAACPGRLGQGGGSGRMRGARSARRGELWIRGPNVVKGYWEKPKATAESFTDGWLHTGDVARLDDRGLRLHRRPDQGHAHPGRREHLLRGNRGRAPRAPGCQGRGDHRHTGSGPRRGGGRRRAPPARRLDLGERHPGARGRPGWPPSRCPCTSGSPTSPCRATRPASFSSVSYGRSCSTGVTPPHRTVVRRPERGDSVLTPRGRPPGNRPSDPGPQGWPRGPGPTR